MYQAKEIGRNNYQFYSPEMTESAMHHVHLENALHNAVSHNEFKQLYQPQYLLANNSLVGCETLIRWLHPSLGVVTPNHFIPMAEQNGVIKEIDSWMLQTACRQGRVWLNRNLPLERISVNMTGLQIQRDSFAESIYAILEQENFPKQHLEIEVTESFLMQKPDAGIKQLQQLYEDGISIAIDDFGTGYSSLSYLKILPVNKIKLDRAFIMDIDQDKDSRAIVKAMIDLAKSLDKTIIAEGVESIEQAHLLNELGCEQAQGYYFESPTEVGRMTELLTDAQQSSCEFVVSDQ
jgi:EAL domain-containing protein (putative c-di-GMP-specific phosphodiesterase class I)